LPKERPTDMEQIFSGTVRHLRPPHACNLNRSYTEPFDATNVIHSASDSSSDTHSKAVYWTATNLIKTAYLKNICVPVKTLISW
jgi:hypothetical protein